MWGSRLDLTEGHSLHFHCIPSSTPHVSPALHLSWSQQLMVDLP